MEMFSQKDLVSEKGMNQIVSKKRDLKAVSKAKKFIEEEKVGPNDHDIEFLQKKVP